jgi:hypothetical protein
MLNIQLYPKLELLTNYKQSPSKIHLVMGLIYLSNEICINEKPNIGHLYYKNIFFLIFMNKSKLNIKEKSIVDRT